MLTARAALAGRLGPVVVVYGDTPLIEAATLRRLAAAVGPGRPVAVAGMRPADPGPYGRLVTGPDGTLERIVEAKDATAAERAIGLCNAGVMAVAGEVLWDLLEQVRPNNAKGEYYLTDVVGLARGRGLGCAVIEADAAEVVGVNSRVELAEVEALFQARMRRQAMLAGATLIDPASVWFSHDTVLGRDVVGGAVRGVRAGGDGGGQRGDQGVLPPRGRARSRRARRWGRTRGCGRGRRSGRARISATSSRSRRR